MNESLLARVMREALASLYARMDRIVRRGTRHGDYDVVLSRRDAREFKRLLRRAKRLRRAAELLERDPGAWDVKPVETSTAAAPEGHDG